MSWAWRLNLCVCSARAAPGRVLFSSFLVVPTRVGPNGLRICNQHHYISLSYYSYCSSGAISTSTIFVPPLFDRAIRGVRGVRAHRGLAYLGTLTARPAQA
eukprot:scaffold3556_cov166-Isochrysis_galbana.AAC.1